MENLYAVLGVGPLASSEEIKSAYRRCAREAHPDRNGSPERFRAVQGAYALLSDPDQRAQYDTERRAWMMQIGAVACSGCGHANRILRALPDGHVARCGHCRTPLPVTLREVMQAQRQALVQETARILGTVGVDLAELAVEGVRAGLSRLRQRFGLSKP